MKNDRDERINIRVSKKEKHRMEERAKRVRMNVSEYIRYLALNAEIDITIHLSTEEEE